jgi:hypothetical protein
MAEIHGMVASKATQKDVNEMREFLFQLEEKIDDQDIPLSEIGKFCHARFKSDCGRHFRRVLFGYETLVENACDPELDYLEWKPEIKAAITAANTASSGQEPA